MAMKEQVYGFYIPTVTLMGIGAHKELGSRIKTLGAKKPLIVTDKGITKAGLTQQIADLARKDGGVEPVIFDETIPNPTDKNVHDGVDVYKKNGCDMIITLGGGSSHDCGKGIGIVVANGGSIKDYEGIDKSTNPMPPFIAINTTAGTASEMTRFCIITDTSRKVKMAIVDWRVTPTIAINDPLLMAGMPPSLTAATG
ncbi:MAG TPA: iron-containing alcohol dehydrogenase, partial [Nitrospirota bacterium]|nr:iron-containing alcohol dehydrogenase [Nitrospirota bacterium]